MSLCSGACFSAADFDTEHGLYGSMSAATHSVVQASWAAT